MSGRSRITKGVGREANPLDGDEVVINLGVRDGKVAFIGAESVIAGGMVWASGGTREMVWFKTGAEARAQGGETFKGCESARRAVLVLADLFSGREIDDALRIGVHDVVTKMGSPVPTEACVMTVVAAVRRALIDSQVLALAEATVEARSLHGVNVTDH